MYLKCMKAYGFKSFADKIEINFEKNINGIVGPNGSGKSNVVDAVRWVLGEQSIKSLRGDTSTDVIFSGSKSRKPLNSAMVTLIFDNSDFYLPIQYTEVSVKRVMYRSGENEYYLNNEKCRLKDITNLLIDTGADKESFNIISQGKIDEILSTKPGDRRAVFESAAGVIKYKKRKEEAVKKLERTNLNMNRVEDILRELENNLSPLEKQSKDATRYLEIKDVYSQLSIALAASDITKFNHEIKSLEERINTLNDEVVSLSNTHSSYDIDLLTKKDEVKKIEEKINQEQNTLLEVTRSIEKINADIRLLKMKKQYSDEQGDKDGERLLSLKENLLKINRRYQEEVESSQKLVNERKSQQETIQQIEKKYFHFVDEKNKLKEMLEKNDREIYQLKLKIEHLENSIESNGQVPRAIKSILDNPRLLGAHHIVGHLLSIQDEYVTAITTALAGSVNHLVVDSAENAKRMVSFLKENKLGRATFLPLDRIKPRNVDSVTLDKLRNQEGFIDVASSLVTYDSIYENIVFNLLGNIIVVDHLDHATKISQSIFNRYKIVTLDGQVINIGGSITGGSNNIGNNVIKERYELETSRLELERLTVNASDIQKKLEEKNTSLEQTNVVLVEERNRLHSLEEEFSQKKRLESELKEEKEAVEGEIKNIDVISQNSSDVELEKMLNMYYSAISSKDNMVRSIHDLTERKKNLENDIQEIEGLSKQDRTNISQKEKTLKELEIKRNILNIKLDNLLISLGEEYNLTYEAAINRYPLDVPEDIAREKVKNLKNEMKDIGYVNVDAIEEYQKVKERYEFLDHQRQDLKQAEATLLEIMKEMDTIMKEKFLTTFESVRVEFKKVFRQMFRGGEAELILTDPDHLLDTGIEIQAIPSGKNLKSITLLSGGEKTFTAISLLFAILNVRPVPFCLLDEVEAALDDANVESFGHYLDEYRDKTQFILITHKKKTMEFANTLYGITMQESGVSKLVSVRLEDIEKDKK